MLLGVLVDVTMSSHVVNGYCVLAQDAVPLRQRC